MRISCPLPRVRELVRGLGHCRTPSRPYELRGRLLLGARGVARGVSRLIRGRTFWLRRKRGRLGERRGSHLGNLPLRGPVGYCYFFCFLYWGLYVLNGSDDLRLRWVQQH